MAKSDLLKEAIADAKAVKETALANAKIALEEAFAPRIQSMLSTKLAEDEMYEEDLYPEEEEIPMDPEMSFEGEMDLAAELGDEAPMEAPMDDLGMDGDLGAEAGMEDDLSITVAGQSFNLVPADGGGDLGDEAGMDDLGAPEGEPEIIDTPVESDDLDLESIIRELEEDLNEGDEEAVADHKEEEIEEGFDAEAEMVDASGIQEDFNIDEIIESILSEEDDEAKEEPKGEEDADVVDESATVQLKEAYDTIHSLRHTINEVNLLNAKLLYTNKLFRNFELNENQKMKVIENFDRAGTTREVKLVFSTLAESFNVPVKKRKMVKESYASKPSGTTAPSNKTKQIINEGNELANRWKKLAGLLPK